MTSPFEKHGIDHLSPSSLNTFAAQPSYWAFKYLLQHKDEAGPSAWRGSAVEAGLDHWLYKRDEDAAREAAANRFELEALGLCDDYTNKERLAILPMLEVAIRTCEEHQIREPTLRQESVRFWFDGIEVPIIGKIDYEWEFHGIDLKTTNRMPTQIPDGHARQISLYQAARSKPYKLFYVTGKKAEFKELTKLESELQLKRLAWLAHTLRRALATFSDKTELARLYPPDFNSFYWKSEEARTAATEIWQL